MRFGTAAFCICFPGALGSTCPHGPGGSGCGPHGSWENGGDQLFLCWILPPAAAGSPGLASEVARHTPSPVLPSPRVPRWDFLTLGEGTREGCHPLQPWRFWCEEVMSDDAADVMWALCCCQWTESRDTRRTRTLVRGLGIASWTIFSQGSTFPLLCKPAWVESGLL